MTTPDQPAPAPEGETSVHIQGWDAMPKETQDAMMAMITAVKRAVDNGWNPCVKPTIPAPDAAQQERKGDAPCETNIGKTLSEIDTQSLSRSGADGVQPTIPAPETREVKCPQCGKSADAPALGKAMAEAYERGLEKAQWQLPDPPADRQWHRVDGWKQEWLYDENRPLLKNEVIQAGDEILSYDTKWVNVVATIGGTPSSSSYFRTRRPL